MKTKEKFNKLPHKKLITAALVVIAILVLGWIGYLWYKAATVNYAQEVARPIEEGLVKAGARKMSTSGNNGRGPDNREPWYDTTFEIDKNKVDSQALIQAVTQKNGYDLVHATPSNRGHLGAVADIYIQNWYFDNSSKPAAYPGLATGNINLAMAVNYDQEDGSADSMPTTLRLQVRLPSYK